MSGLTLIIEQNAHQFYWTVLAPSGRPAYFSIMYDDIKLAIDSAKAHIYNMNNMHVVIGRWDARIQPHSITDENTPEYEHYFRNILKNIEHKIEEYLPETEPIPVTTEPEGLDTEPEPERTPPKRGHLSLVQD